MAEAVVLSVAGAGGETDAFIDEPLADAEPASGGIGEEETQLCDARRFRDEKHAAGVFAAALGDPASLARRIEVATSAAKSSPWR